MKALTYSIDDVATAKWVRSSDLDHTEQTRTWARKVLKWWRSFRTMLSIYAKAMGSSQLAMIAIWNNLRSGIGIGHMLRDQVRVPKGISRWQRRRFTERDENGIVTGSLSQCHHAKGKWELHAKRRRQVDAQVDNMNAAPLGY